jgi:hypothetical protein
MKNDEKYTFRTTPGMTAKIRSRLVFHVLFLALILIIATITSL